MEIEKEKRKIEFWDKEGRMNEAFYKHRPEKPFRKNVEVIVTFTNYADCEESRQSTQSLSIPVLAAVFSDLMDIYGYIRSKRQIVHVDIDKRESTTPGIAFFMQEVE